MRTKAHVSRKQRVEIIQRQLLLEGSPRSQLILILFFTGLAGFLASFSLLHLGLWSMGLRYPIAILVAYSVFLALLRLWLWLQRRNIRIDLDWDELDVNTSDLSSSTDVEWGDDQNFGDGGTGGSWEEGGSSSSSISSDVSPWSAVDGIDNGEGFLVFLAVVAVVGGLLASLYIVYIAPALLAEILVDGLLVASLYKRVKGIERRHWLRTALRKTIVPALLTALFFSVAGFALQRSFPEASSIGEIWRYTRG